MHNSLITLRKSPTLTRFTLWLLTAASHLAEPHSPLPHFHHCEDEEIHFLSAPLPSVLISISCLLYKCGATQGSLASR